MRGMTEVSALRAGEREVNRQYPSWDMREDRAQESGSFHESDSGLRLNSFICDASRKQ